MDPGVSAHLIFSRMLIQLDILLNDFFIDRLLLKKGHTGDENLLATSFELVALVLVLWTNIDRFMRMRACFEWLVSLIHPQALLQLDILLRSLTDHSLRTQLVGYGAPASGILCKEVLMPTLRGRHPKDPRITRSSIIQKLSLFVGFLDWVNPAAPNAYLCSDCKSVIQRVLDQALNTAPSEKALPDLWDFPNTQLDFNSDLFDTYDWLRADL
jgi:hypothetical protein